MTGIAPVGSVGAGLSGAQLRAQFQAAAIGKERQVARDIGNAALQLLNAVLAEPQAQKHDLDVFA